jgi:hypothetical protein
VKSLDPDLPCFGSSRTKSAPQSEHLEKPSRYSVLQFGQNIAETISHRTGEVCTEAKGISIV